MLFQCDFNVWLRWQCRVREEKGLAAAAFSKRTGPMLWKHGAFSHLYDAAEVNARFSTVSLWRSTVFEIFLYLRLGRVFFCAAVCFWMWNKFTKFTSKATRGDKCLDKLGVTGDNLSHECQMRYMTFSILCNVWLFVCFAGVCRLVILPIGFYM